MKKKTVIAWAAYVTGCLVFSFFWQWLSLSVMGLDVVTSSSLGVVVGMLFGLGWFCVIWVFYSRAGDEPFKIG